MGDTTAWSVTAATNATADATINWAESQAPSTVNDSARAMMAALKQQQLDLSGTLNATGAGAIYAVTLTQTPAAYVDGLRVCFKANADCAAAPQANFNSLGVKDLKCADGSAIAAADIVSGQLVDCVYSAALGYLRIINLVTRPRTKVITFTRVLSTASGSVSHTGVGFKPATIWFVGANASGDGYGTVGFVDRSLSGGALGINQPFSSASSKATPIYLGTNITGQSATVSSFDSDGFTLAWTKVGSPTGTITLYAICEG